MRQLTGVSRKISSTQRVDTDGNRHLRGNNDYVRVPAKHKSRTTGHADPETTEDFAQILMLVMWIPTIPFAVGVHKFRKERLRVEQYWLRVYLLVVQKAQELES